MNEQSHADSDCKACGQQYRRRRTVLDGPDVRMSVRMQMIGQRFHRGVEQLGGEDQAAREQHQSPPHRLNAQYHQDNYNTEERQQLKPEILLAPPGGGQSRQGELQPADEGLVLVGGHQKLCVRRAVATLICSALVTLTATRANAAERVTAGDLWTDTKLYFTSPLRWDPGEWLTFAGVVGAVAASHEADKQTRRHFAGPNPVLDGQDKHSTRDFLPAGAALAGTWLVAQLSGSNSGRTEAYTMAEAAAFSTITAEALKYAAGRKRPNETLRVDDWRAGGSSFPSLHTTAAFAIGTVLAESGNDDFRWTRRILGYGIGVGTAYLRLHGNQHWLSDVVAGAAIGIPTGLFTLNRRSMRQSDMQVMVTPAVGGGVALNFTWTPQ